MKTIKTNKKNGFIGLIFVLVSLISLGTIVQSCSNEEEISPSREVKLLQESEEYITYMQVFDLYREEIFNAINSMSVKEKNHLFSNVNNDDVLKSFIEEYNLSNNNIKLQKSVYLLLNKNSFNNLDDIEKGKLFRTNFTNSDFPRLKNGGEIGPEPCEVAMRSELAYLNSLTALKLLGCTCMLELPVAACICYTTIMIEHYKRYDEIQQDYNNCIENKN